MMAPITLTIIRTEYCGHNLMRPQLSEVSSTPWQEAEEVVEVDQEKDGHLATGRMQHGFWDNDAYVLPLDIHYYDPTK